MIINSFLGPILFVSSLILMFILVPRDKIKEFLPLSLLAGFGLAIVLILIMQNIFGFWQFGNMDFFIAGIPVLLSATWTPLIIIFSYLISEQKLLAAIGTLVVGFPLISVLTHYYMLINQLLTYNNWNLLFTFILSVVIHIGITFYLYTTGKIRKIVAS